MEQRFTMNLSRKDELIAVLTACLQAELKAVKMYSAHAAAIEDAEIVQGLLAILEVEQGHARALVLRIQALGVRPAVAEFIDTPAPIDLTRDPALIADLLRLDLADEGWAINHYGATIAGFLLDVDDETLVVLEENLMDELRHARWLRDRLQALV